MLKSLIYKEWLKVRWTFIGIALINVFIIISIGVSLANAFSMMDASKIYADTAAMQGLFYFDFRYIPLISGLLLGIVQFYPEINSSRIKLTLHLPMTESKSLMSMQLFGIGSLVLIFLVDAIILLNFSLKYFPGEIVDGITITILPWILSGLVIYIFVTIVFVEPSWSRRVIIGFTGLAFVDIYHLGTIFGGTVYTYSRSWWMFVLFLFLISPLILWSGNNYKRGVK